MVDRTARDAVIYEALRFANWAAGEGICPVEGQNAAAPEDFLMAYSNATDDDDWETLPDRIAALEAQNKLWQQNMREAYEAFTAMRNDLNELFPMQSAEADLLEGPEWSVTCAAIVDAARDRFAALEAQLAERVKVKALDWVELNDGKVFRALLPIIGSIHIEPYGVCGWWEVLWSMPGQCDKLIPDVFDTPDEAKAAAQADYERRVLSALEASPLVPLPDETLAAKLYEVGNQIHNIATENQNDEGLSSRLAELASRLWSLAGEATPPAPKVTATTDHDPKLGTTLHLMKQSWESRQPTNSGAPKVTDEMVERGAKKLLLVMPELLRLYPSTAGEVARRDVREVLDAALSAAQEAAPKVTEEFKKYRRKQVAELRPWSPGECMDGVSVSGEDAKAGSPKLGDMIARNPKNHDDKWLVAAAYFADNFEPLPALSAAQEAGKP